MFSRSLRSNQSNANTMAIRHCQSLMFLRGRERKSNGEIPPSCLLVEGSIVPVPVPVPVLVLVLVLADIDGDGGLRN